MCFFDMQQLRAQPTWLQTGLLSQPAQRPNPTFTCWCWLVQCSILRNS